MANATLRYQEEEERRKKEEERRKKELNKFILCSLFPVPCFLFPVHESINKRSNL